MSANKKEKTVDVIILTYRPDAAFSRLLRRLFQQTYPINKIHVINTEQKYWELPEGGMAPESRCPSVEVTHIPRKEFDHAATRQMAAEHSEADLFVLMTMDAIPGNKRLIEELVRGFEKENVAVSYARQLPRRDAGLIERYTRLHNYPPKPRLKGEKDIDELGIKTYFCSDVCAAYDRRIFLKLGGFSAPAIFNEDMVYAAKAIGQGYNIYYAADAAVIHSHDYSGVQQFKRNFDLGVSQAQHPEVFAGVPSESAGIAMVKKTAVYLCRKGQPHLLFKLVWQSACKYAGYRLGKGYRRLPAAVVKKCTASPIFWEAPKSTK